MQGWVGEKCQSGAGPIEIIDNWYVAWLCNLREVSVTETDKFFLVNNLQISVVDRINNWYVVPFQIFSFKGEEEETSNRSFIQPFDIQNQQNWRNDKCKIHTYTVWWSLTYNMILLNIDQRFSFNRYSQTIRSKADKFVDIRITYIAFWGEWKCRTHQRQSFQ